MRYKTQIKILEAKKKNLEELLRLSRSACAEYKTEAKILRERIFELQDIIKNDLARTDEGETN